MPVRLLAGRTGAGAWEYRDRIRGLGMGDISTDVVGWGSALVDFDLDGLLDLAVANGGRLVIPGHLRRAMGLSTGDELVLILDDTGLRVLSLKQAVAEAQERVRRYAKGASLSDSLLAERRNDVENG